MLKALQHLCASCFALCLAVTTFTADMLLADDDRAARPPDHSMMIYYVGAPAGTPVREQYLYQELLEQLLQRLGFRDHAGAGHCTWRVLPESQFGSFSLRVYHASHAQRLACLRDAVNLLLYEPIGEFDFLSARRELADATRSSREPNLRSRPFDRFGVLDSALRMAYQKGSTLDQLYSIRSSDVQAISYDEFERWLRRTHEAGLISLDGERQLLESLGLPLPDRMVLRMVLSLESQRVPAGVLFFEEGEKFGISALILLKMHPGDDLDRPIRQQLSCGRFEPSRLAEGSIGETIAAIFCNTYTMLNEEVWTFLSVKRVDGANDRDFCRQVQALTSNTDIATLVRLSAEGTKGLYVLLPPRCDTQQ